MILKVSEQEVASALYLKTTSSGSSITVSLGKAKTEALRHKAIVKRRESLNFRHWI